MIPIEPLGLEADDAGHSLAITWSDGHTSRHDFSRLRRLCPCAECKGEWGMPGTMTATRELSADQIDLVDLRPVGRYGLTPVLGDGHSTGIYTYNYLRENCECPECATAT